MESTLSFYPLLIISGLALAVPVVVSRFRRGLVPIVVGEILVGIAFGDAGLGLIDIQASSLTMVGEDPEATVLSFLSLFGFSFLMFLAGLEVDFGLLSRPGQRVKLDRRTILGNPFIVGIMLFAMTLACAIAGVSIIPGMDSLSDMVVMSLVLSTTSLGVVVPTLRELGLSRERLGQTILMAAFVADFATILLLTLVAGVMESENMLGVALVAVLFAAFVLTTQVGARLGRHRLVRLTLEELAHATAQLQVRGALALMLVFVVLAQAVEAELILGAFLAGAAISSLSRAEGSSLRMKLDAIGFGFFVPLFFITVGASFDLGALRSSNEALLKVPLLLALAYAVKLLPSALLALRYPWREALSAGVLLSARLSLIIAASVIGFRLGVIDEATNSAIILVAIFTSTISPALFTRLLPRREERRGHAVIVGANEVGRLLAQRLGMSRMRTVLVEHDVDLARRVRGQGFDVVCGDPSSVEVMAQAGASDAAVLVAATDRGDLNLTLCLQARERFQVPELLGRASDDQQAALFAGAGIRVVSEPLALAMAMEDLVPHGEGIGGGVQSVPELETVELCLTNPALAGRRWQQAHLPGDAIILSVRRGSVWLDSQPDATLQLGDMVMIAGSVDSVREASRLLDTAGD